MSRLNPENDTQLTKYQIKVQKRKDLLEKHPELLRTIDTKPLKKIVDYDSFLCSPKSSIARNQAIKDSDIDGGLVITNDPLTEDLRLDFINELRSQGFKAYDITELIPVEQELKKLTKELIFGMSFDWARRDKLRKRATEINVSLVQFFTPEEIENLDPNKNPQSLSAFQVYNNGFQIE